MEKSQAETAAKKLGERGKRLWHNYRWTNEMYDALFDEQDGRCAGCGRKPLNAPLNIDHEHLHIVLSLTGLPEKDGKWMAVVTLKNGRMFAATGSTRAIATLKVKDAALPHSVRGLLCPGRQRGCNRLLGRIDSIPLLQSFLVYLQNPPAKKVLDKFTHPC